VLLLLFVFFTANLNFFGVKVTKYASAIHRVVSEQIKVVVVWLFFIAQGSEIVSWVQLLGFALLLVGNLLYNDLIKKK